MNQEINRILWQCSRGMREIDLLLREFSQNKLNELNKSDIDIFNEILNYDDQRLYDFIFKKEPLDNRMHEKFIETNLKKFNEQGNF